MPGSLRNRASGASGRACVSSPSAGARGIRACRSNKRLRGALATTLSAAAFSASAFPASAAPRATSTTSLPPTLAGETFTQNLQFTFGCGDQYTPFPGGIAVSGHTSFAARDGASGPYAGTYAETGSLAASGIVLPGIPPPIEIVGTLTSFDSTFTIAAGGGPIVVRGTNTLDPAAPSYCAHDEGIGFHDWADSGSVTYDALITTAGGTYRDTGTALVSFSGQAGGGPPSFAFNETFTASNGLRPTEKQQCKRGGWTLFGVFKNQGDCVSYVATGGRNTPSG